MRAKLRSGAVRLLGRDEECRCVDELLNGMRTGESRALVIQGQPGAGKTALLGYAAGAAPDVRVMRAVAVESESELAFAALHQLCGPMAARLGRLPDPQRRALATALGQSGGSVTDPFLVGLAVLGLLAEVAAEQPLLCVVDDAHWMDTASAQILAFAAMRLSTESVGILFATRDAVPELRNLPTIGLGGLDPAAARGLLLSTLSGPLDERVRERLIAEAHGNPLALLELTQHLTTLQLAGGFGLIEGRAACGPTDDALIRRLQTLPAQARRFLLLAAAEPIGDPLVLLRAGERLGLPEWPVGGGTDGLIEVGDRVTFCHPRIRRAVYDSAAVAERREVHQALADVTDRDTGAGWHAWHLGLAAPGPDETVASELERSAQRVHLPGVAATAAFLRRAAELTADPRKQVQRALAAARASLQAGAIDAAARMAATAEARALTEAERSLTALVRAQIAFGPERRGDAAMSLFRAAQRVDPRDASTARSAYAEALTAALFAGRLAKAGSDVREVARALRAREAVQDPQDAAGLLLDGWATVFTDGCATAAPALRAGIRSCLEADGECDDLPLLWLAVHTAAAVWDDTRWEDLSNRQVELARASGSLSQIPLALNWRSCLHLFRGELEEASSGAALAGEALAQTGGRLTPWAAIALASMRGDAAHAVSTLDHARADATDRGEGISVTIVEWARALLYNGLGRYDEAFAAATQACDCPTRSAATAWGMVELVEASVRTGHRELAAELAARLNEIADAAGTDWARGVRARSLALLSAGETAEQLYLESLDRLQRCRMRVDLARAHLLYGEWLRRENRRVDARSQLRTAHEELTVMGIDGFAERAGRELRATGETPRKRTADTRDDLTPQERQIAQLARDGLSNPEIGAQLFLSRRTVEWHLRHVFAKLGIQSRRELGNRLDVCDAAWQVATAS